MRTCSTGSWDPATANAYDAAFEVPGACDAALNWYQANIFAGRLDVKKFTADMPSTLPPNTHAQKNVTIAMPTLVLCGMADTTIDNQKNLEKLVPSVPQLTVKKYANVSHWVAQEVPDRVSTDWAAFFKSALDSPQ